MHYDFKPTQLFTQFNKKTPLRKSFNENSNAIGIRGLRQLVSGDTINQQKHETNVKNTEKSMFTLIICVEIDYFIYYYYLKHERRSYEVLGFWQFWAIF